MTTSRRRRTLVLDWIDALPVRRTVLIALALGLFVVDADLLTGDEISFSVFYVAPIALVAWRLGRSAGFACAVLAAVAWYAVELVGDRQYSQPLIPVWNGLVRLGFFSIIAGLLVGLRDTLLERSEQARVDPLTGVLNRRGFDERAALDIDRAARSSRPMTIATFDIDHFKRLNDSAGHAAGDDVLRRIGQHLQSALRNVDVIGRLGGDEFAVLLPETDAMAARLVLDRLNSQLSVVTADSDIGFSFGVITFLSPPTDIDSALARADALMYGVKADGRGGIRYAVEPAADPVRAPSS